MIAQSNKIPFLFYSMKIIFYYISFLYLVGFSATIPKLSTPDFLLPYEMVIIYFIGIINMYYCLKNCKDFYNFLVKYEGKKWKKEKRKT